MKMLKPVIVLTIICIITAALLGATYNVTAPLIAKAEKAASDAAMIEVVPGATSFTAIDTKGAEGVLAIGKDDSGNGYAFKVQDKGFGGAYTVMVGINAEGKITGVKLMDNSETPGLGSKTGMPSFTDQFKDMDKSLTGVTTVTGATISSKAFIRCVDKAFVAFETVGEGA